MDDFRRVRCGAWVLKQRKNTCFMYVTMSRKLPRRELFFDTSQCEPEVLGGDAGGRGSGGRGGGGNSEWFFELPCTRAGFSHVGSQGLFGLDSGGILG